MSAPSPAEPFANAHEALEDEEDDSFEFPPELGIRFAPPSWEERLANAFSSAGFESEARELARSLIEIADLNAAAGSGRPSAKAPPRL